MNSFKPEREKVSERCSENLLDVNKPNCPQNSNIRPLSTSSSIAERANIHRRADKHETLQFSS